MEESELDGAPSGVAPGGAGEGSMWRGRYEPVEPLARGGQGEVWRGIDRQHDRIVALKVRPASDPTIRHELLEEARLLLALDPHPGMPLVRDDFFLDDHYVIVMDWVEGTDLARELEMRGDPGLPLSSVLDHLGAVAEALDHLHRHDPPIVHGDVKPANIIRRPDGRTVLVDFGVATSGGQAPGGSVGFQAPEVSAGGRPSPSSDVYGLAANAVALLCGRAATEGHPDWEGVDQVLVPALERAVRRGLSTDPQRRPRTATELVERLRAVGGASLPTGVVTFLLTDIQGSTALWDEHGAAMQAVLERHDDIVAECVDAHRGRLIKSKGEGDSSLSVFHRATDAVDAALDLQRSIRDEPWPRGIEIRVRSAIHTGEAQVRDGDYYGGTVNRAARVRGLAAGGQILLSEATAQLVSDVLPAGASLRDAGHHELKGLGRPEHLHDLSTPDLALPAEGAPEVNHRESGRSTPSGSPPRLPLPSMLATRQADLVGRDGALSTLQAVWERTAAEGGQVVLVTGDAGIGKTSLVSELGRRCHRTGAMVVGGRCDQGLAVPYQPFVEALRHVVESDAVDPRSTLGRWPGELVRLLPELAARFPHLPAPMESDAETERWRLFEAIRSWLSEMAADGPVLLVIDDIQWATESTLLLLRHVLAGNLDVAVVATVRTGERGHPVLDATVSELHSHVSVTTIELSGLGPSDLERIVEEQAVRPGRPLAARLAEETGGNPFFVREILRHLAESGNLDVDASTDLPLPASVHDVLSRRIADLDDRTVHVCTTAALCGSEVTLDLLASTVELPRPEVVGALEVLAGQSTACNRAGQPALALDASRRSSAIARRLGNEEMVAFARGHEAWSLRGLGRLSEAEEAADEAWELAAGLGHVGSLFQIAAMNGYFGQFVSDPRYGLERIGTAIVHEAMRTARGRVNALREIAAFLLLRVGDMDGAERGWAEIEEISEGVFDLMHQALKTDPRGALATWGRRSMRMETTGQLWTASSGRTEQAVVARQIGDLAIAEDRLRSAVAGTLEGSLVLLELPARTELARVLASTDRADEGREHLERAHEIVANGEDWRGRIGDLAAAEAEIAAADGNPDGASAAFEQALEVYERFTLPWEMAAVHRCWAATLLAQGEQELARDHLGSASDAYQRLGAAPAFTTHVEALVP